MVYVVANDGQPLIPTNRDGKVYRSFDKVRYQDREYFIFGRRKSGFFDIRTLSGEKVNKGRVSVNKLTFVWTIKNYFIERRTV